MEQQCIPNHATMGDMPSATNTDHDGRYYIQADIDTMLNDGTVDHGNLGGLDTGADHSYINQDVTSGANVTFGTIGCGAITSSGASTFNSGSVDADFTVNWNTGVGLFVQGSDGRVGIGTVSPGASLEIQSSNPILRLRATGATADATAAYVEFGGTDAAAWVRTGYVGDPFSGDTDIYLEATVGDLHLGDSSGTDVLNLQGGNVGIGLTTVDANYKLIVRRAADINLGVGLQSTELAIAAFNDALSANIPMRFYASEYNLLNGNVGINTTTPISKLSINGGLHVGGDSDAGDNNLLVDGTIGCGAITSSGNIISNLQEISVVAPGGSTSQTKVIIDGTNSNKLSALVMRCAGGNVNDLQFLSGGEFDFVVRVGQGKFDMRRHALAGGAFAATVFSVDQDTGLTTWTGGNWFNANVTLADNVELRVGSEPEAHIYSDSDCLFIVGDDGAGLEIQAFTTVKIGDDTNETVFASDGSPSFIGTAAINGLKLNIVAKTANYNVAGTDDVITCGAGNETFTIDLPSPVAGQVYHIKNVGTGTITVDANVDGGTTIDGGNTAVLTTQYECITIISNGTVYWIL